jgi:2'-5' RNA ligase
MSARIRTFVAVDTAGQIRRKTADLISALGETTAKVKWVDTENLHLTLKFLGDVDEADVVRIAQAIEPAVADLDVVSIRLSGLGAFPNVKRPRTIWVGVGDGEPELASVHQAIEAALARLGFPRERRRFHPHLTIGRVRDSRGLPDLSARLVESADCDLGQVNVTEVRLYSSQLRPAGPVYTVMARAPIGG